jgi:hypothetical protein
VPGLRKRRNSGKCGRSREDGAPRAQRPARRSTSSCGGVALLGYESGEVAGNAAVPAKTVRIAHRHRRGDRPAVAVVLRCCCGGTCRPDRLHAEWWISASSEGRAQADQTSGPFHRRDQQHISAKSRKRPPEPYLTKSRPTTEINSRTALPDDRRQCVLVTVLGINLFGDGPRHAGSPAQGLASRAFASLRSAVSNPSVNQS